MTEEPSKLEKIAGKVSGAVIAAEYALCYNNYDGLHASGLQAADRFRWLPIEQSNFGDTPEIFSTVLASGFVGSKIEEYGKNTNNRFLEFCGKYFPTITAAAVGTYYTLGETVLPQLLPGTADLNDVPAVLITAVASPFVTNYLVKSWRSGLGDRIKNLFREASTPAP